MNLKEIESEDFPNCDLACANLGFHRIYASGQNEAYSVCAEALRDILAKHGNGAIPAKEIAALFHKIEDARALTYETSVS